MFTGGVGKFGLDPAVVVPETGGVTEELPGGEVGEVTGEVPTEQTKGTAVKQFAVCHCPRLVST